MRIRVCCLLLCILLLCAPLCACAKSAESTETFFFMDTLITVTLYTDGQSAKPIFAGAHSILAELDALWSRTREGSDTWRINQASGESVLVDVRTQDLLSKALEVSLATKGAFDITVAPLVELWQRSEKNNRLPTSSELTAALALVGEGKIGLKESSVSKECKDVAIDLGGIGKGAAISQLIAYLESCDLPGGLVSFGSNVAVFGAKPDGRDFRIALRNPTGASPYAGTLTVRQGEVLSVSGDYERYYTVEGEHYHHILDPQTGYPSEKGLTSVAVLCADGALADALSTALFVMGEEEARELYRSAKYEFEAVFISKEGKVTVTEGLENRFTP